MNIVTRFFNPDFWGQLLIILKETLKRFPLPVVAAVSLFCLVVFQIHANVSDDDFIIRLMLSLGFAMPWFTASQLYAENSGLARRKEILISGVVYAALIWQAIWSFETLNRFETYLFLSGGAVLSLMFAPYIRQKADESSVWYYNYQLFVALFFAGAASLILCGGLSIILVSIGYLFEFDIDGELYADIWAFGSIVFGPVYFLSHISKDSIWQREDCIFPVGVSFIQRFVLVPLALVYMAVLYAYFVKIGVQWELPRGHLGWMISSFGTIGIITYLTVYPLHDKEGKLLGWFYKNFFTCMLVPIVALALAIYIRIDLYGFTIARYAVVSCLVWFAVLAVWRVVLAKHFHLKFIPMVLAALFFVASMGPMSAYKISMNSQFSRLEALLEEVGDFSNQGYYKLTEQVSFDDRKEVSSVVEYINKQGGMARLRPWFEDKNAFDDIFRNESEGKKSEKRKQLRYNRRYGASKEVMELLGMRYVNRWQSKENENFKITLKEHKEQNYNRNPIIQDTLGYRYVSHIRNVSVYSKQPKKIDLNLPKDQGGYIVRFTDKGGVSIQSKDVDIDLITFDVLPLIEQIVEKPGDVKTRGDTYVDRAQMVLEKMSQDFGRTRIVFEEIGGRYKEGGLKVTKYNLWIMFEKLPAESFLKHPEIERVAEEPLIK